MKLKEITKDFPSFLYLNTNINFTIMGYQITFVPTEEAMSKFKPWNEKRPEPGDSSIDSFKFELISYCMKKCADHPMQILKQIKFLLRCIAGAVETSEKTTAYFRWKDDEKHELYYCGWEYAHDSHQDKDELIDRHAESLFILTDLVTTPDYFDERDKFYEKYKDVETDIDDFIEIMSSIVIHNIINDLNEFEKVYDSEENESDE